MTAPLLLCVLSALSQKRSVDLEVICVSPADTVVNGVGERLRFGTQNNGPDTLYNQDTVLYWLYVFENDSTGYVVYSGATIGTTVGFVPIGGARYYNDNYNITFPYPGRQDTFTVEFCVAIGSSYIDAQGDTVHPFGYVDPNNDNNFCCSSVTVVPKPAATSISDAAQDGDVVFYPNPVREFLHIRLADDWKAGDFSVTIRDVNGRQVFEWLYSSSPVDLGDLALHIGHLPVGIYHLRLQSEKGVVTHKIVIDPDAN